MASPAVIRTNLFQVDENGPRPGTASSTAGQRRPRSARSDGGGNPNRLTITNALESEIPVPDPPQQRRPSATASVARKTSAWATAEAEKQALYESARAKVDKVQGIHDQASSFHWLHITTLIIAPQPVNRASSSTRTPSASASRSTPWPTSEEEKAALFEKAQAAAQRNQAEAEGSSFSSPPLAMAGARSNSSSSRGPPPPSTTPPRPSGGSTQQYLTADQEKAALRHYHDAKQAVKRTQGYSYEEPKPLSTPSPDPIPYEALFSGPPPPLNGNGDMPPSFDASTNGTSQYDMIPEKERLRRAFSSNESAAPPPAHSPSRSASAHASKPIVGQDILSEKERLRRKYEEDDARAMRPNGSSSSSPQPPAPRAISGTRPKPTPPVQTASSSTALTADQEKALLRAKYAAESGVASLPNGNSKPIAPPPLMPRPPAAYIQETQEEDARVSQFISSNNIHLGLDPYVQPLSNGVAAPPPLPPKPLYE